MKKTKEKEISIDFSAGKDMSEKRREPAVAPGHDFRGKTRAGHGHGSSPVVSCPVPCHHLFPCKTQVTLYFTSPSVLFSSHHVL